jgi:hypothetical protein
MHPNFGEFYQKALIPIGDVDKSILHHTLKGEFEQFTFATHWLIALEGNPILRGSDHYHWRVMVYPSNRDSVFHYKFPHFVSEYIKNMDTAIVLARTLENQARNAGICSCSCQLNLNVV